MTAGGGAGSFSDASPAPEPASLFRQRNFSSLWWGQLISLLGERLTYLALVGLLAEHTGHFADPRSSQLLTLLAVVMLAPVLLFAPFTGAWVDRLNLRRVLIVSDTLRAGMVALIPVMYATSHHTLPVYALVFGLFACNVFFLPAKSAITPEIVPTSQLLAANALLAGAGIAATAAGALGGGWVVDHWGWSRALWINGVTYLVSVAALAIITYRPHHAQSPHAAISLKSYLSEVGAGWAVVRGNRGVGLALLALGAVWVAGGFLHVAGNQHIQRSALQPGMERVGVLLAVLGLGSGLGTWWVNAQHRRLPPAALLGGGLVLAGMSLAVFASSTRFAVFAAAAFVTGIGAAPAFTLTETLLQECTETRQRGRVFSARDFLMRLVFLIGVSVAGAVTRGFGTRAALEIAAGALVLAGLVAWVWGRSVRR
ncbi:MAG: MFS transporter [Candidatus Eisenbacteria bacterium]|uniref:MFS transporter n=1 Tax=Eiseniibacteriota bacterium TaxID=2212470 RepID=A0A538U4G8_UNCEI|nr:MAG: MFS transporter [Candidatus Eisenbacteria bacterium]